MYTVPPTTTATHNGHTTTTTSTTSDAPIEARGVSIEASFPSAPSADTLRVAQASSSSFLTGVLGDIEKLANADLTKNTKALGAFFANAPDEHVRMGLVRLIEHHFTSMPPTLMCVFAFFMGVDMKTLITPNDAVMAILRCERTFLVRSCLSNMYTYLQIDKATTREGAE